MYYLIISITNKRLLRQRTGGACLYVPQDRYWLGSFDAIPPTPKVDFSAAKKKNPQENYFFRLVSAGIIQVKMAFFRRFFLKFCQTDLDSRKQQAILLKKNENSPLKTAVSDPKFWRLLFFGENFVTPISTLANIKGSLPTNSTTPDRLRCHMPDQNRR